MRTLVPHMIAASLLIVAPAAQAGSPSFPQLKIMTLRKAHPVVVGRWRPIFFGARSMLK